MVEALTLASSNSIKAWKISMIFNKWHYWELNRPFSQEMNLEDEINHIHNKWIWKTAPFSHKMNLEDEINRIHNKWIWRINHFHKKWIWKIAPFSHEMDLEDQINHIHNKWIWRIKVINYQATQMLVDNVPQQKGLQTPRREMAYTESHNVNILKSLKSCQETMMGTCKMERG
jgi:hypothetical protein